MRKHEKIIYEIDPHNRLVLKSGKPSDIRKYRLVLDGTFRTDKSNYLVYHIKKPSPVFDSRKIPQKIRLKGSWSFAKNYRLIYKLDKWNNQIYGNKLVFQNGLMDANENELFFTLTTKDDAKSRTYILGLHGRWCIGKLNQLTFLVKRDTKRDDEVFFKGEWKVNRNNRIVYSYARRGKVHSIILDGYWDITRKHRLFYYLDKKNKSFFEFKVSLGTAGKRNTLQYALGVGISGNKRAKTITLFGKWKLYSMGKKERLGLLFEMNYGNGIIRAVSFGGSVRLNKNGTLEVILKKRSSGPLGVKLTLSKTFLTGKAKSFITLLKDKDEIALKAGYGFLF